MRRPGLGTEPSAPSDPLKHEGVVLSCAPFPAERARAFSGRCARTPPWSSPSRPVSPPPLLSCLSALATEALFLPRATPPPGLPRRADPPPQPPALRPRLPPTPSPSGFLPRPLHRPETPCYLFNAILSVSLLWGKSPSGVGGWQAQGSPRPEQWGMVKKDLGGGGREGGVSSDHSSQDSYDGRRGGARWEAGGVADSRWSRDKAPAPSATQLAVFPGKPSASSQGSNPLALGPAADRRGPEQLPLITLCHPSFWNRPTGHMRSSGTRSSRSPRADTSSEVLRPHLAAPLQVVASPALAGHHPAPPGALGEPAPPGRRPGHAGRPTHGCVRRKAQDLSVSWLVALTSLLFMNVLRCP